MAAKQPLADRLAARIEGLAEDPRPRGAEKFLGRQGVFRIRVGAYRILYSLEPGILLIVTIDKRSRVYKR
jgi:mRNA interferase RelE/StbE